MTYDQLVQEIISFCNRVGDATFALKVPSFIQQAIYIIYSKVRTIGFQKTQAGGPRFTAGQAYIAKPPDWKETVSLSYVIDGASQTKVYILPRTYEFCNVYSPPNTTGNPVFYADYNSSEDPNQQIYLAPAPANNYQYELVYLGLPNFSAKNQFDYISSRYPSLLLDTSLLRASIYLKDDERIAPLKSLCDDGMAALGKDTTSRYTDRLSRRDKD